MKLLFTFVLFSLSSSAFAAPKVTYLLKTASNDSICVDSDIGSANFYQSFRMFFKNAQGHSAQLPVSNVVRMRDGGTTTITLTDGRKLFYPSALSQNLKPTFDGADLTKVTFDFQGTESCTDAKYSF